jgi:DUF4097 and DUF4098 domain-containing protein YvlB
MVVHRIVAAAAGAASLVVLAGRGTVLAQRRLGSGSINGSGASEPVQAETGSGDITVTDVEGAVSTRTGSGSVTGRGLGGGEIKVETGSGDISLELDTAAAVSAHASSGAVDPSVPAGRYRVRSTSGSGPEDVSVTDDPTASLLLDVRTGSGDITISQR